ncbi:MAG: hypothetical protein JSV86_15895 [Gemmatimonadota bacterium]|nr:MAG: hypothetical protein JSV86_15895 [Gemmatimonadota bacterium]
MLASIDPLLIQLVAITCALGIPGVALAGHLVLRPLVRDITKAIQAGKGAESSEVERRLARLEDAYYQLDQSVTRLLEAEDFRRQLERGREEGHGDRP